MDDVTMRTEITPEDWSVGPVDAPVTILEYGDFECPYCGRAERPLREVREAYSDLVRFVYRHFPITSSHPHAEAAAEAAEAAGAQGKFWPMHDLIFANQQALTDADLRRYAQQIGLDLDRFDRDMAEHTYRAQVREDFRSGIEDGVNGTPTIFINRVRYDGPREFETLAEVVDRIVTS